MKSLRAETRHDPYLVGNGTWCSTCCPDGPPEDLDPTRFRRGCNECTGRGRIAFSAEEIISRMIAAGRAGTTVTAGEAR